MGSKATLNRPHSVVNCGFLVDVELTISISRETLTTDPITRLVQVKNRIDRIVDTQVHVVIGNRHRKLVHRILVERFTITIRLVKRVGKHVEKLVEAIPVLRCGDTL